MWCININAFRHHFFTPLGLRILPSAEVITIYDYMEDFDSENAILCPATVSSVDNLVRRWSILISFDFDPGTAAENQPMGIAVLRHAMARNIPVFLTAQTPMGQGLAGMAIDELTDEAKSDFFSFVAWSEWSFNRDLGIT